MPVSHIIIMSENTNDIAADTVAAAAAAAAATNVAETVTLAEDISDAGSSDDDAGLAAGSTKSQNAYIFNQYYIDLLRRVKDGAKAHKERSKTARDALRAIKRSYATFDKTSLEHRAYFARVMADSIDAYLRGSDSEVAAIVESPAVLTEEWFEGIPYSAVRQLSGLKPFALHQYWTLFSILSKDDVDGKAVVEVLQKVQSAELFAAGVDGLTGSGELIAQCRARLSYLRSLFTTEMEQAADKTRAAGAGAGAAGPAADMLKGLEDTTLGKLAKEIMEDPEIAQLHQSIRSTVEGGEEPNLMNLFADGAGGGISKLMGTVSEKMVKKLMTGEIKQETLLQDAMQFASKMQQMMPGGMMSDLAGIGNLLNVASGAAGSSGGGSEGSGSGGGFDFSSLLGALGGGAMKKKSTRAATASRMSQHSRKSAAATRARQKLDERRKNMEASR